MRFQRIARNINAGFHRGNAVINDHPHRHLTQPHSHHLADAHRRAGDSCPEPGSEKFQKNQDENESNDSYECEADQIERFHEDELRLKLGQTTTSFVESGGRSDLSRSERSVSRHCRGAFGVML